MKVFVNPVWCNVNQVMLEGNRHVCILENAVIPPRSLLILDGRDRKGEAGIFDGTFACIWNTRKFPVGEDISNGTRYIFLQI